MDNPIYLIDRANWDGVTTSILNPQTCCSEFNPDKTMAMLIEEYKMVDPDIITIDELTEMRDALRTPWVEESKEEFYELYECLPPMKTFSTTMENGDILFGYMCPEATMSFLHSHGLRITQGESTVYLSALKSRFDKWEELVKEALDYLNQKE